MFRPVTSHFRVTLVGNMSEGAKYSVEGQESCWMKPLDEGSVRRTTCTIRAKCDMTFIPTANIVTRNFHVWASQRPRTSHDYQNESSFLCSMWADLMAGVSFVSKPPSE